LNSYAKQLSNSGLLLHAHYVSSVAQKLVEKNAEVGCVNLMLLS